MEFSISTFNLVMLANVLACTLQFQVQRVDARYGRIPPRHSLIPGTSQEFLYWQDFHTQTWGDCLGLGLIWVTFAHYVEAGLMTPILWVGFAVIAVVDAVSFRRLCLSKRHKPDWVFPSTGTMSAGGWTHLPYHGIGMAAAAASLWLTATRCNNLVILVIFAAGVLTYSAAFAVDVITGHFDPLRRHADKSSRA
ncbi:MAG: hypothetical protein UY92_C0010G0039 [Candidatus Magasanikbacteria bacterium GW2011_GWA2_56_11]|uniref:Uncharacterized protein n=1 Tax=Candidatus Magasanikbacteria bacterium GW2011_GWA2_56_11 TaxID=1619044 RepID=A0A0G1YFC0_9BACT|nr:MAG: hypothetical protein UY92_C0010G0039 [Candidatus Magasanikbacteria bacterium GW2011_GWA2_56_11]